MTQPLPANARSLSPDEPLHVRLSADVKRRLESGEWKAGEQLPTEHSFSAEYGVSRATVRMALKLLESNGLVRTRQGAGTFVTAFGAQVRSGLQELRSTSDTIRAQGFEPSVRCRLVERRTASEEFLTAFSLTGPLEIVYLEREIQADGKTVAFAYEEVLADLISVPLEPERFSRSIFELMRETRGIEHGYASAEINSVYDDSVGWGEGRPERPLYLLLRQSHFTRQGEATIYSRNFYVEGAFKFSIMRIS